MKLHLKHLTKEQMELENELGIKETDVSDLDSSAKDNIDNFNINLNPKGFIEAKIFLPGNEIFFVLSLGHIKRHILLG